MEITDLFSHKIHSSSPEWADKLIELAFIFAEFDGRLYNRSEIEERLKEVSPRATLVGGRDPSKFRDEISAYPAYLGLYRLELENGYWIFRMSETAKRFLVCDEPNVQAFMLLQLTLFQYPNGMGIAYGSNSGSCRLQANTRDRTLGFIQGNVHISPLRLICKALTADSQLRGVDLLDARISPEELFALANQQLIYAHASPDLNLTRQALAAHRAGLFDAPDDFENRMHILNHTDLIVVRDRNTLSFRDTVNAFDRHQVIRKINTINQINTQFNGFDTASDEQDIIDVIKSGHWGRYFDSLLTLTAEEIEVLSGESVVDAGTGLQEPSPSPTLPFIEVPSLTQAPMAYPLRARAETVAAIPEYRREVQFTDPEITRIRRQRSNLIHKTLLQQLSDYIRAKGIDPLENEHIDLFAQIPDTGNYLFEVKSITEANLLSQTRKGISQLYEYRYRYRGDVGAQAVLCLVFPHEPAAINWLQEYLCVDREIAVVWFDEAGELRHSHHCTGLISGLLN